LLSIGIYVALPLVADFSRKSIIAPKGQPWFEARIFAITYGLAKMLRFTYEDAALSAMIGASNHFEWPSPRRRCCTGCPAVHHAAKPLAER
jgi:ACR3 family arsenite efflux pump ArsB